MLPGRLGLRFALEALFLVLLAIGAGLADLRPAVIVLVMAVAWVLVALIEFTAERIASSPTSYLLPTPARVDEGEDAEPVVWPRPEERTVVAPPERPPEPEPTLEPEPEPEVAEEAEPEPEQEPEAAEEPEPEAVEEPEPEQQPRRRRLFRRRKEEDEPEPSPPPRHVKLLPRRSAPEPSRAAQEVAELFGSGDEEDSTKREESGS
jgi:outer membrane biosynthesis protein TonB